MNQSVIFGYGALSQTLEEQANNQGYTLGKKADKLEKLRQARLHLMFGGILTDSQLEQTAQKLQSQVVKALKPNKKSEEKVNE